MAVSQFVGTANWKGVSRVTAQENELLQAINAKVDQLLTWQTKQSVVCMNARHKLDTVATEIWGNGKTGLKTKVDRLTDRNKLLWAALTIAGTVTGMIAGMVAGHYWMG